ncbi:MAG: hypothetical protein AAFU57_09640 [Bacteroidota bacterium]
MLKQIGAFVFFSLLLFKVSAFHVYEHHHSEEEHEHTCEHCAFALDFQKADVQVSFQEVVFQEPLVSLFDGEPSFLAAQINTNSVKTDLFSRPPPFSFR